MEYKVIAEKIIELKNADLELRQRLIQNGELGEGYNKQMEKLHCNNAKILSEIKKKDYCPSFLLSKSLLKGLEGSSSPPL